MQIARFSSFNPLTSQIYIAMAETFCTDSFHTQYSQTCQQRLWQNNHFEIWPGWITASSGGGYCTVFAWMCQYYPYLDSFALGYFSFLPQDKTACKLLKLPCLLTLSSIVRASYLYTIPTSMRRTLESVYQKLSVVLSHSTIG